MLAAKDEDVTAHTYETTVTWSAGDGLGTANYRSYSRNHAIEAVGKEAIAASSDPAFRGERDRYNPEELFVAALSSCHMLWYLHLCAVNGVVVRAYRDAATGRLQMERDGSGQFVEVELHPVVTIAAQSNRARALALHGEAHRLCFLARSVNFPVQVRAEMGSVRLEDEHDE